ncbi:alpha/beta hydrolase [Mesoplasma chauliocola]|uniref:Alpha/beta hydrolase n=1 Tax=Mesoplasma chauliocola TaxID=216427 RepID=A0A249SNA3_9MOLU|nr:alpha/beta fold hydrolase [Mesoplasma chauliocola]ASZ09079.1 alpha/beta hydrolase [Mesoplasma chauliocola]
MNEKEFKKAKKELKKYKYTFLKVIGTIILFPIVLIVSFILTKFFNPYLFKYPRVGLDEEGLQVNNLEHYLRDIKQKNLKNMKLTKKQIEIFEIGKKDKKISCLILKNDSNKWVVSLHGFKRNKYIGLRNSIHFYKKGYNIISFDAYAHGETYGKYSDLGLTNSKVLNEVIDWVKNNKSVEEIGVLGVSMGAATAIYWAQQYYHVNQIDWLISDCSLTNPVEQIRFFLKKYFKLLPWWIASFKINSYFKKHSKTDLDEMNLQVNLNTFDELPVLFIHGKKDSFIDYNNSIVMYYEKSKTSSNNELKIFDNAEHSMSIVDNQKEYAKLTLDFVNKYMKKK